MPRTWRGDINSDTHIIITMPGSRSIGRLLERHKTSLSSALRSTNVLENLLKKGVITAEERDSLMMEEDDAEGDVLVRLFSQKGFNSFRELCVTLEMECPQLLTALLLDNGGGSAAAAANATGQ